MADPFRVLLLDDEPYMLQAYQRMLRTAPFDCYFEQSCAKARQLLSHHPFHLLLLDYLMPEQNGLDFCKEQRHWASATRCYLLTGMEDTAQILQARETGVIQGYLAKPISKADLMAFLTQQQTDAQVI